MAKDTVLTPERRKELLTEVFELQAELDQLELAYEVDGGDAAAQRLDEVVARLEELRQEYVAALPKVPLSRCPFCDQELIYPIDAQGLDGLWWDIRTPVRAEPQQVCPHFLGLTGAIDLGQGAAASSAESAPELPVAPILVEPGPEAPFVLPRLLDHEAVQAVVSTTKIGEHTAYPIAYYADPVPEDARRVNTWGADRYEYRTSDDELKWGQADDLAEDCDFDLKKRIENGRVKWIAPGDEALALHEGLDDCPFLDLEGRREILCVQDGKVWGSSDAPQPQAAAAAPKETAEGLYDE